jgi:hypothetical protein
MARKTKATKRGDRVGPADAATTATAPARSFAPPQRRPVLRDMSCSVKVGVFPSQLDCAACESLCARLPHSWRQTCLATCRSACAVGRETASAGRAIGSAVASIGSRFAAAFH